MRKLLRHSKCEMAQLPSPGLLTVGAPLEASAPWTRRRSNEACLETFPTFSSVFLPTSQMLIDAHSRFRIVCCHWSEDEESSTGFPKRRISSEVSSFALPAAVLPRVAKAPADLSSAELNPHQRVALVALCCVWILYKYALPGCSLPIFGSVWGFGCTYFANLQDWRSKASERVPER